MLQQQFLLLLFLQSLPVMAKPIRVHFIFTFFYKTPIFGTHVLIGWIYRWLHPV